MWAKVVYPELAFDRLVPNLFGNLKLLLVLHAFLDTFLDKIASRKLKEIVKFYFITQNYLFLLLKSLCKNITPSIAGQKPPNF